MTCQPDTLGWAPDLLMAKIVPEPDLAIQERFRRNIEWLATGKKRKDFAADIGMSGPYLTQIINKDRVIPLGWAPQIAKATNRSPADLLFTDLFDEGTKVLGMVATDGPSASQASDVQKALPRSEGHRARPTYARLLEERKALRSTLQYIAKIAVEGYENNQQNPGGPTPAQQTKPRPGERRRRPGG